MQNIEVRKTSDTTGLVIVIALLLALAASPPAGAVVGSTPANPTEAPWMVKVYRTWPSHTSSCSGQIVAEGLILTAGHCISEAYCDATVRPPTKIVLKFGNAPGLRIDNPAGPPVRVIRHPSYSCPTGIVPAYDVGFVRFRPKVAHPTLPLASPQEIASFANRGVTVFGGGAYKRNAKKQWIFSNWIRKSYDGGLFLNSSCNSFPYDLCFRVIKSAIKPGDSGGAFVGWVGGWKLLAVVSGWGASRLDLGASLADPATRGWIDQQIAAGRSWKQGP